MQVIFYILLKYLIDIRIKVKIAFNKVLEVFIFKHYVSRTKDMLQYLYQEIEKQPGPLFG